MDRFTEEEKNQILEATITLFESHFSTAFRALEVNGILSEELRLEAVNADFYD